MSFELEQLREEAEKYTHHDAGTHWGLVETGMGTEEQISASETR